MYKNVLLYLKGVFHLEISIKDLIRIVKNGIWFMVITALVFAVVAFGYSKIFIQKTYVTSVKLYVETNTTGNTSHNDLSAYNYAASLVNTYIEMLETNNFYQQVAENLEGKYTVKKVGSMIKFSNDSETEVFKATITAGSPEEAKTVADSVANVAPGVISRLNDNANLKIVDNPVLPTSAASPNVSKNTFIAMVAGFALAFLFILIRELVDIKFKYNTDMTNYNGIPVLAAIPDFDSDKFSPAYYFSKDAKKQEEEKKEV